MHRFGVDCNVGCATAQSRKLAGALWEMSQKVSKVSEVRRHEFEKMVKERRAETMVRVLKALQNFAP